MKASIRDSTNPKRGRPKTTGMGLQIGMRWHEPELKALDAWRRKQDDLPTRSEAIRRLVAMALGRSK